MLPLPPLLAIYGLRLHCGVGWVFHHGTLRYVTGNSATCGGFFVSPVSAKLLLVLVTGTSSPMEEGELPHDTTGAVEGDPTAATLTGDDKEIVDIKGISDGSAPASELLARNP